MRSCMLHRVLRAQPSEVLLSDLGVPSLREKVMRAEEQERGVAQPQRVVFNCGLFDLCSKLRFLLGGPPMLGM